MPPTIEDEDEFHGDTIIVKGEYPWSRPSSPDSMSPDIQPLVQNLLAQINTPRELESPEPMEGEGYKDTSALNSSVPHPNPNPSQPARATRPKQTKREPTTMEERLILMPEKRPLPWREGVEPGAENETGGDSRRKQIRFGCLLATRGEIQQVPCNSCANGRGKFNVCVALDGFFKGACASCQLSGRPNRCSIKKNDDVPDSSLVNTPGETVPRNVNQQQQQSSSEHPPKAKRRRTDVVPDWESARPQWEQELGDSHARQQQQMKDIVQRPWATVNSPVPIATATPQGSQNGMNGSQSAPTSTAWATVNQPAPPPAPPVFSSVAGSNGGVHRGSYEQSRREETVANEEGSASLIDSLPKNKQRQVYGLISGLQGGIEHLQRELDSLKRALGIDDED